ncbi:hypothetical protein [Sphingomonas sp. UYEF23]|uniref:hypothetical protein n=1 Tax=Sphingomonas sp. UYEF23 TaxID=1756408 RepID=UPI0033965527
MDKQGRQTFWELCFDTPQSVKNVCWGTFAAIPVVLIIWLIFNPAEPSKTPVPAPAPIVAAIDAPAPGVKEIDTKVEAEMNLKAGLKDAESATFRNEFVSGLASGAQMLCGEVNSRNSFGGYTGFKRFIASPNSDAPNMIEGEAMSGIDIDAKTFRTAYRFACSNRVKTF